MNSTNSLKGWQVKSNHQILESDEVQIPYPNPHHIHDGLIVNLDSNSTVNNAMMNSVPSFENSHPSAGTSSLPFDFNIQQTSTSQTVYKHLSNLEDHIHVLSKLQSRTHPLSADQPPSQDTVTPDLLAISVSLQNYHATLSQLLAPMNGEPLVLGAETFISRSKEHSGHLSRLEVRKRAIRLINDEIEKVQVKKGGVRRDLRFSEKRIEALVKELGFSRF
jgi:hypothetical protein